ncbi:hypothetical protein [Polyangium sp. y55x31]|uniref:hypothetical protein n=1 Tax=Polyangium sp. y55x31 TaxID=3042688 RepID=UPI00248293DE|nr:hypothetical protein [Polyangium sp. y55x31]MDI1484133.1 hypothetical protein [Polyangium sp. y55x31]
MKMPQVLRTLALGALLLCAGPNVSRAESSSKNATFAVCDVLSTPDVTPGLHGLCVTYCEALDCDAKTTGPCETMGPQLLTQYDALREATDPPMPCIAEDACPCWLPGELAAIGTTWTPNLVNVFPQAFDGLSTIALAETRMTVPSDAFQIALVDIPTGRAPVCSYFFSDAAEGITESRDLTITDAQARTCHAEITERYFALLGLGVPVTCEGNLCTCDGNLCSP